MKSSKSLIVTLIVLIVLAALYRFIPNRPLGFAPQIAMALFGGAMIKDKKWAFALPIFSMFLSDLLYQAFSSTPGFYEGQWLNYCLFAGITLLGFTLKKVTVLRVAGYSLLGPVLFFLLSNGYYWLAGGTDIRSNLLLDRSLAGLLQSYAQGLPFLRGALIATFVFSTILFGGYYLLTAKSHKASPVRA
ncbi:MAG TPA: DUF6580 family putative transport protein [Chitinophagaceae bacterium]